MHTPCNVCPCYTCPLPLPPPKCHTCFYARHAPPPPETELRLRAVTERSDNNYLWFEVTSPAGISCLWLQNFDT